MTELTPEQGQYASDLLDEIARTSLELTMIDLPTDWDGERETISPDVPEEIRDWQGRWYSEYLGTDDIGDGQLDELRADLRKFVSEHWDVLADHTPSNIGYNYVASRNGDGTGFWDVGSQRRTVTWDQAIGDRLHAAVRDLAPIGLDLDYSDPRNLRVRVYLI